MLSDSKSVLEVRKIRHALTAFILATPFLIYSTFTVIERTLNIAEIKPDEKPVSLVEDLRSGADLVEYVLSGWGVGVPSSADNRINSRLVQVERNSQSLTSVGLNDEQSLFSQMASWRNGNSVGLLVHSQGWGSVCIGILQEKGGMSLQLINSHRDPVLENVETLKAAGFVELWINGFQNNLAAVDSNGTGTVVFGGLFLNIGLFEPGGVTECSDSIKNILDSAIVIDCVQSSCGCLEISPTESITLQPGQSQEYLFTVKTGWGPKFRQRVSYRIRHERTSNTEYVFREIFGNVRQRAVPSQQYVDFGSIDFGSEIHRRVIAIDELPGDRFELAPDVVSGNPALTVSVQGTLRNELKCYRVEVALDPSKLNISESQFAVAFSKIYEGGGTRVFSIPVFFEVVPPAVFSKTCFAFGELTVGSTMMDVTAISSVHQIQSVKFDLRSETDNSRVGIEEIAKWEYALSIVTQEDGYFRRVVPVTISIAGMPDWKTNLTFSAYVTDSQN